MGKIVRVDSADNFTVTGILKDLPNNTRFHFEYLLPWSYMQKLGWDDTYWGNNSVTTFLTLRPDASEKAFDRKIKNIVIDHAKGSEGNLQNEVFTHPAAKWHLYSKFENGKIAGGQIETVRLFAIIAAFILLIACINFMNLSTARSEKRAKEVGIRKVVGAPKIKLIGQFLGESILISLLAGIVALFIVQLSLNSFNLLVNKKLFIDFSSPFSGLREWDLSCSPASLPAAIPLFIFLPLTRPVYSKGRLKTSHALITPRKILVVLQFSFAIILIIATIIVEHQIIYAENRDPGYSKDKLIYSYMQGDLQRNYELIRNELLSSGAAIGVTRTTGVLTRHSADTLGIRMAGQYGSR